MSLEPFFFQIKNNEIVLINFLNNFLTFLVFFSGICLPTDLDILMDHMNNARFIRESDFAKMDFYQRTGLLRKIRSCGGHILLGATTIRYRKLIKLFSTYYITTKVSTDECVIKLF